MKIKLEHKDKLYLAKGNIYKGFDIFYVATYFNETYHSHVGRYETDPQGTEIYLQGNEDAIYDMIALKILRKLGNKILKKLNKES